MSTPSPAPTNAQKPELLDVEPIGRDAMLELWRGASRAMVVLCRPKPPSFILDLPDSAGLALSRVAAEAAANLAKIAGPESAMGETRELASAPIGPGAVLHATLAVDDADPTLSGVSVSLVVSTAAATAIASQVPARFADAAELLRLLELFGRKIADVQAGRHLH